MDTPINDYVFPLGTNEGTGHDTSFGLTKRELYALCAMVAMFSRPGLGHLSAAERCLMSVAVADALVAALALAKPPQQEVQP